MEGVGGSVGFLEVGGMGMSFRYILIGIIHFTSPPLLIFLLERESITT